MLRQELAKQQAAHSPYTHFTVARMKQNVALEMRRGSIAAQPEQAAFYAAIGASPTVRTVCEIGFNVGHSALVWLSSSPTSRLVEFDTFDTAQGLAALDFLQRRYPGRVTAYRGDSLVEVPRARLPSPCDVVHIDGRHQYDYVLRDFFHVREHASPNATYVFDGHTQCTTRTAHLFPTFSHLPRPDLLPCVVTGTCSTTSATRRGALRPTSSLSAPPWPCATCR